MENRADRQAYDEEALGRDGGLHHCRARKLRATPPDKPFSTQAMQQDGKCAPQPMSKGAYKHTCLHSKSLDALVGPDCGAMLGRLHPDNPDQAISHWYPQVDSLS